MKVMVNTPLRDLGPQTRGGDNPQEVVVLKSNDADAESQTLCSHRPKIQANSPNLALALILPKPIETLDQTKFHM